jgi:HSP20 family molecular chaperone IbpA
MNSGVIKESENQTQRHLQQVKSRLRREINSLEDQHKEVKEDLAVIHQNELRDLQLDHNQKIVEEIQRKEKIVGELKSNLEVTKKMTDKELKNIKDFSQEKTKELNAKNKFEYEKKLNDNEFELKVLNDKFNDSVRKIHQDGNKKIALTDGEMKKELIFSKEENLKKLAEANEEHDLRSNEQIKKHNNLKKDLEKRNETEILTTHKDHQTKIKMMTALHQDEFQKKTELQKSELEDQKKLHLDKYQRNQTLYKSEADNLDQRYDKLVNDMKTNLVTEFKKTEEKLADPFYQFTDLRPSWRQTVEGIEIKVKIPEYSKQDLHLTLNNKEVVLNFHRRYADKNTAPDGSQNKVSKVESFSTRIDTGVFLNPKDIKSSYENGYVTYVIKRA